MSKRTFARGGALRHPVAALRGMDAATRSQWAYIAEAAFEYFITLTISGAFLTLLVKQMGVSDALAGILASVTILACSFQIFAVAFIRRRRSIKASVLFLQTLQQVLYALLFLLPFLGLPAGVRVALFAGLFLFAAVLTNLVAPAKINWQMSFVPPGDRGIFTAHKEMISLVTGLAYNYGMSRVVDHFAATGRPEVGLQLCAGVIFVLMLLHILTLVLTKDAPQVLDQVKETPSLVASMRASLTDGGLRKLLVISAGWNFLAYLSTPYQSVYLLQELSCSVTFIAVAGIACSVVRIFFSPPLGRFADKHGFARSVRLGCVLAGAAFGLLAFWTPANGKVLYLLYQIPYAAAMATLPGSVINILFQYVPAKNRVGALGLYSALGGISGFVGSLAGGWVLGAVQAAGNTVLGLPLYGQQLQNLLACVGLLALALYMRLVVERMHRVE